MEQLVGRLDRDCCIIGKIEGSSAERSPKNHVPIEDHGAPESPSGDGRGVEAGRY